MTDYMWSLAVRKLSSISQRHHSRYRLISAGGEVMKEEIRQVADNIGDQKRS
jgi:hypothetical protein